MVSSKKNVMVAKILQKIWDVNADNIFISKLVETKNDSKYLIGYLGEVIRPQVLILAKTSGRVWLMSLRIYDKI